MTLVRRWRRPSRWHNQRPKEPPTTLEPKWITGCERTAKDSEAVQPCFYTIISPHNSPGIKLSRDRRLLVATHANISSGILVEAPTTVLKALLVLGPSASKSGRNVASLFFHT